MFPSLRHRNPTIPNSIVNNHLALQETSIFVTTYANAKPYPNNPKLFSFSIINDVSSWAPEELSVHTEASSEHQASARDDPGSSSPISSSKKRFPSLPPYKSFSLRTLISCELFIYEHHKPISTGARELHKSGRSLGVPFSADHNSGSRP